ncbi:MAG: TrpB-like pyridoxal phosphate-dependent enzyme, partial [Candidatus Latescibacteria bacterium]|nr:TrpB-like pyridoxal phosphate-dependent enzyme [Candidatus Latescibacterota bacterium]
PPSPPLHPGTGEPAGPDDLAPLFCMDLILQEVSQDPYIDIPDVVMDLYKMWRPSPLIRAKRFEEALGTPARIYYKYEGVSPAGSHKLNTAVPQAYYNKQAGVKRIATETGAGQWGSAVSMACSFFDLECTVYMVKVSYRQKPYRRVVMETFGATVHPSPTDLTNSGRGILAADPESPGSLGIAISEASEDAATHDDTKYALGSVLNHVLMHQTVIGEESLKQFELIGEYPDVVVGCCGGGSNFGGLAFPFLRENWKKGKDTSLLATEPASCPTLTRGHYAYDFGDTAMTSPLFMMYTLGHSFVPAGIHAGGLRYHGDSPILSQFVAEGYIEAEAYQQLGVFEAAEIFAKAEGIIPAPESAHAVKGVVEEAQKAKDEGKEKTILLGLSGHGLMDLSAYDDYHQGNLTDHELPQAEIERALAELLPVGA